MQKAEAARVQAYEPALAYIATATVYLQTHGKELAVLAGQKAVVGFEASKEWLKAQQPAIQQAWLATVAHSQAAYAALLEWKARVEPLAKAQLEIARVKSLELGALALKNAQKTYADLQVNLPPAIEATKEWAAVQGANVAKHAEPHLKALEPHTAKVQAWADEQHTKIAPHLDPYVKPAMSAIEAGWKVVHAQLLIIGKQLEEPTKALQAWLVQTGQCLCLPLTKPITYEGVSDEYPTPVVSATVAVPQVD